MKLEKNIALETGSIARKAFFFELAEVLKTFFIRKVLSKKKKLAGTSLKRVKEKFFIFGKDRTSVLDRQKPESRLLVEGVMQGENFAAATLLVKHSEEYRVENHDQKKSNYLKSITE